MVSLPSTRKKSLKPLVTKIALPWIKMVSEKNKLL
jgi:hypothetical protein